MEDRTTRFGIDSFRGQNIQIWQGTILESSSASIPKRKLVVSADCDLANDKGGGEFYTLDILRAEEFAKKLVESDGRSDLINILLKAARETAALRNAAFASVSDDVFIEWVVNSDDARWSRDLQKIHSNDKDWLRAIQEAIMRLTNAPRTSETINSSQGHCFVLIKSSNIQLLKQVEQINKRLKEALLKHLQPNRVDLYILPTFPGESDTVGHVVPFKSLKLMPRSQVCMSRAELIENIHSYTPRATCRPVLIQSLLQKMTNYFIRIGITNNFKSEQENVVKALLETMK